MIVLMKSIHLAIAEFALPSPRQGSIDTESGYGALPQVGSEIHVAIQAQRLLEFPGYVAEKWISHTLHTPQLRLTLSGRMDGFHPGPPVRIEEIKTAYNTERLLYSRA